MTFLRREATSLHISVSFRPSVRPFRNSKLDELNFFSEHLLYFQNMFRPPGLIIRSDHSEPPSAGGASVFRIRDNPDQSSTFNDDISHSTFGDSEPIEFLTGSFDHEGPKRNPFLQTSTTTAAGSFDNSIGGGSFDSQNGLFEFESNSLDEDDHSIFNRQTESVSQSYDPFEHQTTANEGHFGRPFEQHSNSLVENGGDGGGGEPIFLSTAGGSDGIFETDFVDHHFGEFDRGHTVTTTTAFGQEGGETAFGGHSTTTTGLDTTAFGEPIFAHTAFGLDPAER